jgi:hypothetical protein
MTPKQNGKTPVRAGMTRTERNELVRIVRGRFKILDRQPAYRIREVETIVRDGIRERHADAIAEAEQATEELRARFEPLEREAADLVAAMRRKGVSPRYADERLVRMEWLLPWRPANENDVAAGEMYRLSSEATMAQARLVERELSLVEELLVTELETADAKTFLAKLPTIEELVPAPKPAAAIASGPTT